MIVHDSQMKPRDGLKLKVVFVCRVSDPGPGKQDVRSLDDQEAMYRKWMTDHVNAPYEAIVIAGSGSGEYLEREEYRRLIELVEAGDIDLVLAEDLGRIIRRIHAHLFCELCVDCGTRLIAINDHVDTAASGWQDRSIFSAWHHERSNRDTSDRIKRTHLNRFDHGGCAPCEIYGIIIPRGKGKTDADWYKDSDAEPVYKEWFSRLDAGAEYADVADWLNENHVPTGPHCDNDTWDGKMVARITHNLILKGVRYRNRQKTRRHASGKYVSEKADPSELRTREVPHLAFFEAAYYDRIIAKLKKRNARYSRCGSNGRDPRQGVPRRRSRFPGQITYCGVCGRNYVFGGHGQKDHLMCTGAREHRCWNGITVDGPLAAQKITSAVFEAIQTLPDFDQAFLQIVNEEAGRLDTVRERRRCDLDRLRHRQVREIDNLVEFIRGGDTSGRIREDLRQLEQDHSQTLAEIQALDRTATEAVVVPSIDVVKEVAQGAFRDLDVVSFEFARLMRRIIPQVVVFPYRLCDGGHLMLRARFRLRLSNLLDNARLHEVLEEPLERLLEVDLFDPPQREEFRERVVLERTRGTRERDIAKRLGITVAAAQRAAALQRKMDHLGITDPYLAVNVPPDDYRKLRRHRHPRYTFEPLDGAGDI